MEPREPELVRRFKMIVYWLGRLCPIKPRNVSEGTEVCRFLQDHRMPTTLGRISKAGDDPEQIVAEYLQATHSLAGAVADLFYLSVKPPALRFEADYAAAIAAAALQNGHGVHFDSHKYLETERTLELLDALIKRNLPTTRRASAWRFSLSIPSRWRRSVSDARWAAERGVRVRLVKGDFAAGPSLEVDPARGMLDLVDLLAGQVSELALATHDSLLARECIGRCRASGTPVTLELLFGRPFSDMLALSREAGVPVGFYVPYGDTLSVYLVRDLLANPGKLFRHDALELLGTQGVKLGRITKAL